MAGRRKAFLGFPQGLSEHIQSISKWLFWAWAQGKYSNYFFICSAGTAQTVADMCYESGGASQKNQDRKRFPICLTLPDELEVQIKYLGV